MVHEDKLKYLALLKDVLAVATDARTCDGTFGYDIKARITRIVDSIEKDLGFTERERAV